MTRTCRVASSTRHGFHVKRQNRPGIPESKNGWNPKFDIRVVPLDDEPRRRLPTTTSIPLQRQRNVWRRLFLCSHTVLCGISRLYACIFPVFCILNLPLLCSLETMECTSGLLPISTEVTAALQLGVTCHDFSDIESGAHIFLGLLRHI